MISLLIATIEINLFSFVMSTICVVISFVIIEMIWSLFAGLSFYPLQMKFKEFNKCFSNLSFKFTVFVSVTISSRSWLWCFFSNWNTSFSPKYKGSQCENFSLWSASLILSLVKALILKRSIVGLTYRNYPDLGDFFIEIPMPIVDSFKDIFVEKQVISLYNNSLGVLSIIKFLITYSKLLNGGHADKGPLCSHLVHTNSFAFSTALLFSTV